MYTNRLPSFQPRSVAAVLLAQACLVFSTTAISAVTASGLDAPALVAGDELRHRIWFEDAAWITNIGTLLYRDADNDGFFSGFSLTVDADTDWHDADVYTSIGIEKGKSERELLHTSANFVIYGNTVSDEYRIDIDLLENYPAGEYDLYINLHDAYDGSVLDSVSARDFSNLQAIPLEAEDIDGYHYPADHTPAAHHNPNVRVVEYAGGTGIGLVCLLGAMAVLRRHLPGQSTSTGQCLRAKKSGATVASM